MTWNEALTYFSRVTDKLGKEIDPGILETVAALNVLGIATVQSCEGHVGWGVPYPWIRFQADMQQKHQLYQYLMEFYDHRSVDFECMLACSVTGYRLTSQGAAISELLTEQEQREKLAAYQAEMTAFTHFLKAQIPH